MKFFFTLLFGMIAFYANCQDCSSNVLMKAGTRLEYQGYAPRMGMFGKSKGYFKVNKLVFTVTAVKDSASINYSYITKEGASFNNPKKDNYKKEIVLACNGKLLALPFDMYNADTTYLSDVYPNTRKLGFYIAHAPIDKPVYVFIPLAPNNSGELGTDKKTSHTQITMQDYNQEETLNRMANPNRPMNIAREISKMKGETEVTIRKASIVGKQTITTPAGSFDCYKIVLQCNMYIMKKPHHGNMVFYYDPAIGCVKFETESPDGGGYVELTAIGKAQ